MAASLQLFLTGGAGNTDPNGSLGGVKSTTQLSSTPLNNLFDNVSPGEASAGDVEYRAIDIYNAGDAAAQSVAAYIDPRRRARRRKSIWDWNPEHRPSPMRARRPPESRSRITHPGASCRFPISRRPARRDYGCGVRSRPERRTSTTIPAR